MRDLVIGGRRIADDTDPYVIADIGPDLWLDADRAELLFLQATMAGARAVLLDALAMGEIAGYDAPAGEPYGRAGGGQPGRRFGRAEYARVARLATDLRVDLVPTVAGPDALAFVEQVAGTAPAVRVAERALTDLPLLTAVAELGRPVLLGVYGAGEREIAAAVDTVRALTGQIALVQCAAPEPRTPQDLNLAGIVTLLADYPDLVVGFSGADVCPEQSWIAYAVGARLIEKRLTGRRGSGTRRPTLDPLGLIRYDGQNRWGGGVAPVRAAGS